ncbi:MAG: hypothetical protein Q9186_001503 [Xanthomendoza sp. 1 TL-2023]
MLPPRTRLLSHIISPSIRTKSTSPTLPPAHTTLPTFLAHARSTALSPTSPVFIGTHYEYLCQQTLSHLGFTLQRTGGRSDRGIDLLGHWHLPSIPHPLRALVQCKALSSKLNPETVRELEGAFAGAPAGWRGENVVGVLCGKREATKGVREAVRRCGAPVVWVMVEDTREEEGTLVEGEGRIRQVLWNGRVSEIGAEGVVVGVKYTPAERGREVEREVVLTWKGEVWEPDIREVLDG